MSDGLLTLNDVSFETQVRRNTKTGNEYIALHAIITKSVDKESVYKLADICKTSGFEKNEAYYSSWLTNRGFGGVGFAYCCATADIAGDIREAIETLIGDGEIKLGVRTQVRGKALKKGDSSSEETGNRAVLRKVVVWENDIKNAVDEVLLEEYGVSGNSAINYVTQEDVLGIVIQTLKKLGLHVH